MAIFNRYVSLAEGTGDAPYCTMNVDELQTTMAEEPPSVRCHLDVVVQIANAFAPFAPALPFECT